MMIKLLDWDTKFFGFKVGQLTLRELSEGDINAYLNYLKDNNFRLVYILNSNKTEIPTKKNIIYELNNRNVKLVDEKVIFEKLLNYSHDVESDIQAYSDSAEYRETLYKLAYLSGQYSRFKLDENFSSGKFEEMYKLWIDNSVNKKIADEIFVYQAEGNICGFVTIKIDQDIGKIGLISVDPKFQGLSIGRKLINSCEVYCYSNDVRSLEVPTQLRNKGAFDFYIKCGFNVKEVIEIYHLWL